ncbi:MAG: hypothetical protein AB8G86_17800, partial [Saprospiraceae bacterium]
SRKGVSGNRWSEVSGTAKAGMYEQKLHKRHRGVVKVARHTEGWLFTKPFEEETKASDVDAGRFSRKRMYLTVGELGLVSLY